MHTWVHNVFAIIIDTPSKVRYSTPFRLKVFPKKEQLVNRSLAVRKAKCGYFGNSPHVHPSKTVCQEVSGRVEVW